VFFFEDSCALPKEVGPCTEYVEKYYFDTNHGKCTSFLFGGCSPNENNFESLSDCEKACKKRFEFNSTEIVIKKGISIPISSLFYISIKNNHVLQNERNIFVVERLI
jgi:hypothetical protein